MSPEGRLSIRYRAVQPEAILLNPDFAAPYAEDSRTALYVARAVGDDASQGGLAEEQARGSGGSAVGFSVGAGTFVTSSGKVLL